MKFYFLFFFILSIDSLAYGQKNEILEIDKAVAKAKKNITCVKDDTPNPDTLMGKFAAFYCFDKSTNAIKLVTLTLIGTELKYEYYFQNKKLIKVNFFLKGTCKKCVGQYYFLNSNLIYKKETSINVDDVDIFLKLSRIIIVKASSLKLTRPKKSLQVNR